MNKWERRSNQVSRGCVQAPSLVHDVLQRICSQWECCTPPHFFMTRPDFYSKTENGENTRDSSGEGHHRVKFYWTSGLAYDLVGNKNKIEFF